MKFNARTAPITSAFVLAMREQFGPGVVVESLRENEVIHGPELQPVRGNVCLPVVAKGRK
jgi:hypothetical protein